MREVNRRRLSRYLRLMLGIAVIGAAAVVTSWFLMQFLAIRRVEVIGADISVVIDPQRFPQNLLFFPTEKFTQELVRQYPLLSQVRVEKKWPSSLVLRLTLREPRARLVSDSRVYLLDQDGIVIGEEHSPQAYPALNFDLAIRPLIPGEKIDDARIITALAYLKAVAQFAHITSITEAEGASLRARMEKTDIFLPQKGDVTAQAATLQTLLAGFRIRGTLPSIIDLRYEKPVIIF